MKYVYVFFIYFLFGINKISYATNLENVSPNSEFKDTKLEITPIFCIEHNAYGQNIEWGGIIVSTNIQAGNDGVNADLLVERRRLFSTFDDKNIQIGRREGGSFFISLHINGNLERVSKTINSVKGDKVIVQGVPYYSKENLPDTVRITTKRMKTQK